MTESGIKAAQLHEQVRANKEKEAQGRQDLERKEREHRSKVVAGLYDRAERGIKGVKDGVISGVSRMVSAINDPQWYANGQLLKDVASFSFDEPIGTTHRVLNAAYAGSSGIVWNDEEFSTNRFAIPGVDVHYMVQSIGVDATLRKELAPVNLAAREQYTFIRSRNSGARNYEPSDLVFQNLAILQVYSFFNFLSRAYGVARTYSNKNLYMPKALIQAMGIDFEDLIQNLANFRAWLNTKIRSLSSWNIPAAQPIIKRQMWMYSQIYMAERNRKSVLEMYSPAGFYKYELIAATGKGEMVLKPWMDGCFTPGSLMFAKLKKVADIKQYGEALIAGLYANPDFSLISGDVLKAYGESGVFTLNEMAEDYTVVPQFVEEPLTQFENLTAVGYPVKKDAQYWTINESDGFLTWEPKSIGYPEKITSQEFFSTLETPLNFHKDNPTPEDVIVASRGIVSMSLDDKNVAHEPYWNILSAGSEICLHHVVMYYDNKTQKYDYTRLTYINIFDGNAANAPQQYLSTMSLLSRYARHAPVILALLTGKDNKYIAAANLFADLDNVCYLSPNDIQQLNRTANFGLWYITGKVKG